MLPHISTNNSKLGSSIPSINLPVGKTCRENPPCKNNCYARKGNFTFKNVKNSLQRNLSSYKTNPQGYFEYINLYLKSSQYKFFRFHSSGDIVDENYFKGMCWLADNNKEVKFLCFTKKYEIVNNYIDLKKEIPTNITIVLSNWGDFICENPHNLPISYVNLRKQNCAIPQDAKKCNNFCGACASTKESCWNLKKGESVVFNQH